MQAFDRLKALYFIIFVVGISLLLIERENQTALEQAERAYLSSQGEMLFNRFFSQILSGDYRKAAESFGEEFSNMNIKLIKQGKIVFQTRHSSHDLFCVRNESHENPEWQIEICRISGPHTSSLRILHDRSVSWILLGLFLLFGMITFYIYWIKTSLFQALVQIQEALGEKTHFKKSFSLQELLQQLQMQRMKIEEFENKVRTESRLLAMGTVSAQVYHDLSNPLKLIDIFFQDLEPSANLKKAARAALERVFQMLRQIKELGKLKQIHLETVNLQEVLQVSIDEIQRQFPSLEFHSTENLESVQADCEPLSLIRIFSNLFKNSAEAQSQKIGISSSLCNESVKICISDWGKGISEKDQEKIFAPFTSFGKEQGTGIGLWHAKQALRAMKGDLEVCSPGIETASTTFILKLQLSKNAVYPPLQHIHPLNQK